MAEAATIEHETDPAASQQPASGPSELCHVMCELYPSKSLCGITDESDQWCDEDPCDHECVVCTDLDELPLCPVCHTPCGLFALRNEREED